MEQLRKINKRGFYLIYFDRLTLMKSRFIKICLDLEGNQNEL